MPTIQIYGEIGRDGITAKQFSNMLAPHTNARQIDVRISSPGGSVWEGLSIYNQIKSHRARVTVHIDGLAASMGSYIAMAGDEIKMASNAMMMIHDPFAITLGGSDDHRNTADVLDKTRDAIAKGYAQRTGATDAQVTAWMKAETWFNADEAVAHGFADSTAPALKIAASFDLDRFGFAHTPSEKMPQAAGVPATDESGASMAEQYERQHLMFLAGYSAMDAPASWLGSQARQEYRQGRTPGSENALAAALNGWRPANDAPEPVSAERRRELLDMASLDADEPDPAWATPTTNGITPERRAELMNLMDQVEAGAGGSM